MSSPSLPEPKPIERIDPPTETEPSPETPAEEAAEPPTEPLSGSTDPSIVDESPATGLNPGFSEPLESEVLLSVLNEMPRRDVPSVQQITPAVEKPTAENAQTFLQELASFWKEDSTATSIEMSEVRFSQAFWDGLDQMANDLDESTEEQDRKAQLSAEAAAGVGISLTAGFVSWALRAGSMAASFLAAMPTWRHFDPMPILSADEKKQQGTVEGDSHAGENEQADEEERVDRLFGRD